MRISFFTLLLCVFAIPTASAEKGSPLWAALGDETPSAELCSAGKDAPRRLCVGGRFTSIAHMRNDSDFDSTPRFFDPNGQTDGQAATFLRTHVRYETGSALHVSYEMEVGWNAWSRHDPGLPDAFLPGDEGGLAYRHRQLFADARRRVQVGDGDDGVPVLGALHHRVARVLAAGHERDDAHRDCLGTWVWCEKLTEV